MISTVCLATATSYDITNPHQQQQKKTTNQTCHSNLHIIKPFKPRSLRKKPNTTTKQAEPTTHRAQPCGPWPSCRCWATQDWASQPWIPATGWGCVSVAAPRRSSRCARSPAGSCSRRYSPTVRSSCCCCYWPVVPQGRRPSRRTCCPGRRPSATTRPCCRCCCYAVDRNPSSRTPVYRYTKKGMGWCVRGQVVIGNFVYK